MSHAHYHTYLFFERKKRKNKRWIDAPKATSAHATNGMHNSITATQHRTHTHMFESGGNLLLKNVNKTIINHHTAHNTWTQPTACSCAPAGSWKVVVWSKFAPVRIWTGGPGTSKSGVSKIKDFRVTLDLFRPQRSVESLSLSLPLASSLIFESTLILCNYVW